LPPRGDQPDAIPRLEEPASAIGEQVFDGGETRRPNAREERMQGELTRAKNVIAEITAENFELKKGLSD
jgi:hypothetical protein